MGYEPKNIIEKGLFFLAGVKRCPSSTLQPGELNAVTNYWLTLSNSATMFSTVLLTIAVTLFIETRCWYIYSIPLVDAILFCIRYWVYSKCASETLQLWL